MEALRFPAQAPPEVVRHLPPEPGDDIWCDLDRADLTDGGQAAPWLDRLHPLTMIALRRERPRHLASAQPAYVHVRLQVPAGAQKFGLDVVLGSGFALTVGIRECHETARLWGAYREGSRNAANVPFALYETLCEVISLLRQHADRLASDSEAVAQRLVRLSEKHLLEDISGVRRDLQAVRFDVAPAVDALGLLAAREEATGQEAAPYLQDVHRQIQEVLEVVDAARSEMGGAVEQYTSVQSTEMNRVMQLFTVVAVIFLPPTLIASIYGMNFRIPEYHWPLGYTWALGLMLLITLSLYAWLRSRRWL